MIPRQAVFGLIIVAPLCLSPPLVDASRSGVTGRAITVLSGKDSHISKEGFHRIESLVKWKKMWLAHLGLKDDTIYRTTMEIDFERYMVVAIFGGKTVNSYGYRVEEVRENNTTVFL